ncbi:MAG TPA: NADH-quinone oxidoreductase subunit NuoF [Candidatus Marinimicrobia bacterium]|jgi:NADH-quinone oxidoreductase subunit F|nr:NADH-quinone oxidoreductase subunit NuoF [Candidatus Neomarinimicrobiota bacterium]HHZ98593.1 NADH-quinone oxidoreductase subunit NuoF [Candidatus Neomarinimicrobiota bacterium]HIB02557.1 NADH-quinone oxidoreductase subunit NuoF [Candidatus Neomarinimicrobiota bacterium]HIB70299.1 NADH-quinone oxidoreductase subunit NuoF [Candidatus Neomarinimicrobiota bacterium]HIB95330.1 NADH-quinone oxidoreductase subunit NuoF [Candidatus Neomarinimicrobiota bacterium]
MSSFEPVLTQHIHAEGCHTLAFYRNVGGYKALEKVISMGPDEVIDTVKASNLRGRGGAGFPAGVKWGFIPKESGNPTYLINNADESEPGTFKDRLLINKTPHQMLEGMIIASYAISCNLAFIYIRGEFYSETKLLEEVLAEAYDANLLGKGILGSDYDLDVVIHRGAGAYICGEETGLIESLEGKRGWPRIKPPFPAVEGYLKCPTVVNNVETLANLPHIFNRGPEWFRSIGHEQGPGPKLYCVSGCVNSPGVFEEPMGVPLKDLIYDRAGGIRNGNELKAVFPGGSSSAILTGEEAMKVNMDFDSLLDIKSMLGSAGIIVMDDKVNMVQACLNIARFYEHESCGQCTPCREGTTWLVKMLTRMVNGSGTERDIDMIFEITDNIGGLIDFSQGSFGKTICPFGEAVAWPIRSFVEKFKDEFLSCVPQLEAVA